MPPILITTLKCHVTATSYEKQFKILKKKRKREKTKIQEKKKIHEKNIVWNLVGRIRGHLVGMEFETKRANGIKEKIYKKR